MRSLRSALIPGAWIAAVLVFAAPGALLYVLLRTNLVNQIDRAIEEKAHLLASSVESRNGKLKLELNWATDGQRDRAREHDYFEIWSSDDTVAYCSPELRDA